MSTSLDKEQATYESQKDALVAAGDGKFVVIKGDKILSFYTTEQDAIKAGYSEFAADTPFLIKKVARVEGVYFFSPSPFHYAMLNQSA